MDIERLGNGLAFLKEAERLKSVLRTAYTTTGRQEDTASHTWRLCLMAMTFERELAPLDMTRVLKLCVLHDLGEAIHGDQPAVAQNGDKNAQERTDLLTVMAPLDEALRLEFLSLWEDYEQGITREARLVKGLDKLETILQHSQGDNPPDFDYAFNLTYGLEQTDAEPVLTMLRTLVDGETQRRIDGGQ
ncbi:HD domain-containing protein [Kushneria konosiri]|uniref:Phosphohydrolase n=1 Tax=Kushneria konosiri TaxID=698828 RepID=A0A2Z2HH54_9GAMM|nr:HD domain-containing protein [Kushneria konosiri]ARS52551.1 phosphohydrolase [Kushneria konosiri]